MKIKAKIELSGANAGLVGLPLAPDNLANMKTVVQEKSVVTYFEADKIGSLIASVDDFLMNAKVAQEVAQEVVQEVVQEVAQEVVQEVGEGAEGRRKKKGV